MEARIAKEVGKSEFAQLEPKPELEFKSESECKSEGEFESQREPK